MSKIVRITAIVVSCLVTSTLAVLPILNAGGNKQENVKVTDSGLKIVDIQEGTGKTAQRGDTVDVHYTGWLKDGTKFDSSKDRGKTFAFTLGAGMVIKGWDEGVQGMKIGGTRKLIIPPALGYGARGAAGVIPPNAELTFEVELFKINGQK